MILSRRSKSPSSRLVVNGSLLGWPILTVTSIPSSARIRAEYDTASSEVDMATFVAVTPCDAVVGDGDGKFRNEMDAI